MLKESQVQYWGSGAGGAMAVTYLSSATAATDFRFAVIFCGYLPTTHRGLTDRIDAAAPIQIPTLFYIGENDEVIPSPATHTILIQLRGGDLIHRVSKTLFDASLDRVWKTLFFPSEAQHSSSSSGAQPEKARPERNTSQPPENAQPDANANGKGGAPDH